MTDKIDKQGQSSLESGQRINRATSDFLEKLEDFDTKLKRIVSKDKERTARENDEKSMKSILDELDAA